MQRLVFDASAHLTLKVCVCACPSCDVTGLSVEGFGLGFLSLSSLEGVQIEEALKAGNWVLKSRCIGGRRSKHPIYERGIKGTPTYQTWVGCSTPSDNFNKSGLAFLNRLNRQRAMEEYEY